MLKAQPRLLLLHCTHCINVGLCTQSIIPLIGLGTAQAYAAACIRKRHQPPSQKLTVVAQLLLDFHQV